MKTKELVEQYLLLCGQKGHVKTTLTRARAILLEFISFLNDTKKKDLRKVIKTDIENFKLYVAQRKHRRTGQPLSIVYKNQMLGTVKNFISFLFQFDKVLRDAGEDVVLFKEVDTLPRNILTEDEAGSFFETIDQNTTKGFRDFCLLKLLYHTGIRKGELCLLKVCDVDFENKCLYVLGKLRKKRVVPLGKVIFGILSDYITKVRPKLFRKFYSDDYLFFCESGRRLYKNFVNNLVKKYRQKADLTKKITSHSLRHTFATHLLENGANIVNIQKILGHVDVTTTEIYTRVTIKTLREVYDKSHPRAINPPFLGF